MEKKTHAKAPATVANVGCGFDIFGFALDGPCDEVTAELCDELGAKLLRVVGDGGRLPLESSKNTATVAVNAMLLQLGSKVGVSLELFKKLPLSSGLGSSAASAVAALVAVNELLGTPFTRSELLPFAIESERAACGTGHADNVAPSLLGGFVLIRSYEPLDVISIPFPESLHCAVLHPFIEVRTEDARRVLKRSIPLPLAVANWGNTAGLIAGLCSGDLKLIGRSIEDKIFEPDRSLLIPGFSQIKAAALKSGALGCSLSGSGPSIFALCESKKIAREVASEMKKACELGGLDAETFVSPINPRGAEIL